jgi:primosomal protein N' (replication factor Y)
MNRQPSLYPATGRHVVVAVAAPVPEGYTYSVDAAHEDLVVVGARVRVRFAGRPLTGVVVRILDEPPDDLDPRRIRAIDDVLDRVPIVPPALLQLAARVADACLVGLGEVLALCLPPGGDQVGGRRVRLLKTSSPTPSGCQPVFAVLAARGVGRWVAVRHLEARCKGHAVHASLFLLAAAGAVEMQLEDAGGAPGAQQIVVRWNPALTVEDAAALTRRAPRQAAALPGLAALPAAGELEKEVCARLGLTRAALEGLARKGIVERVPTTPAQATTAVLAEDGAGSFALTGAQEAALELLEHRVDTPDAGPLLLHGVTGSGKTEVYLRAAARAVAAGRGVLLLVPEIGLTPQLEQRARAVLGDQVVVVHSGMAAGTRAQAWWKLRAGHARVVVGPRSAVFSPLENVGLIVLDEEQDSAYKQAERPRYHGREAALWRAEVEGAAIVLGSATPAIESYAKGRDGSWTVAAMPERVGERPLPATELVDMRDEWRANGRALVSARLEEALGTRLARGEQALVMLNRRGFASAIICRSCGDRGECPNCAVSLTYHRQAAALVCHYCDHREPVPSICALCGSTALHDLGHGTQRLHEALAKLFPGARIERFDADQTQRRGAHGRILSSFGRAEIDILVGTQMLAKGHDFAAVTLVGVVDADASLGVPDFRAAERTFQLLTQVAGRAGRGHLAGEVILQAHQPDHYAIHAALRHDYAGFYEREIEFRRRLAYPPFSALAVCLCRGKVATTVKEEADRLAAALRRAAGDRGRVLGPASPPIGRLRGKFRLQILVKARTREVLPGFIAGALEDLRGARQVPADLVIDIVPDSLL